MGTKPNVPQDTHFRETWRPGWPRQESPGYPINQIASRLDYNLGAEATALRVFQRQNVPPDTHREQWTAEAVASEASLKPNRLKTTGRKDIRPW